MAQDSVGILLDAKQTGDRRLSEFVAGAPEGKCASYTSESPPAKNASLIWHASKPRVDGPSLRC